MPSAECNCRFQLPGLKVGFSFCLQVVSAEPKRIHPRKSLVSFVRQAGLTPDPAGRRRRFRCEMPFGEAEQQLGNGRRYSITGGLVSQTSWRVRPLPP
jgi:hypothetical protein